MTKKLLLSLLLACAGAQMMHGMEAQKTKGVKTSREKGNPQELFDAARDCENGHHALAELLYRDDAPLFNVNARDENNCTPLMIAAVLGNIRAVEMLLGVRKTKVNVRNNAGQTALMFAAAKGSLFCVDLLFKAGAKINVRAGSKAFPDRAGWTALMFAAEGDHDYVAQYLIEQGAALRARDHDGFRACDIADAACSPRAQGVIEDAMHMKKSADTSPVGCSCCYR